MEGKGKPVGEETSMETTGNAFMDQMEGILKSAPEVQGLPTLRGEIRHGIGTICWFPPFSERVDLSSIGNIQEGKALLRRLAT